LFQYCNRSNKIDSFTSCFLFITSVKACADTPGYAAPEQFQNKPGLASDQYALGVMVYQWLVGMLPFEGDWWAIGHQKLTQDPPPLRAHVKSIPSAVEDVVSRALARDPKARFASVQDFATALAQAAQEHLDMESSIVPASFQQGAAAVLTSVPTLPVEPPDPSFASPPPSSPPTAVTSGMSPTVVRAPKPIVAKPASGPIYDPNAPWGTLTLSDGKQVPLTGEHAIVGRYDHDHGVQPEVDLGSMSGADTVTRVHATIEHIGSAYTLTDLNSSNATRINGKRLKPDKPSPINDGDTLQFGKVTCTFKKTVAGEAESPPLLGTDAAAEEVSPLPTPQQTPVPRKRAKAEQPSPADGPIKRREVAQSTRKPIGSPIDGVAVLERVRRGEIPATWRVFHSSLGSRFRGLFNVSAIRGFIMGLAIGDILIGILTTIYPQISFFGTGLLYQVGTVFSVDLSLALFACIGVFCRATWEIRGHPLLVLMPEGFVFGKSNPQEVSLVVDFQKVTYTYISTVLGTMVHGSFEPGGKERDVTQDCAWFASPKTVARSIVTAYEDFKRRGSQVS